MKKQKKILISIIIFITILLSSCQVFATSNLNFWGEMQFSERFLQYMELSDEERKGLIVPRMYDIPKKQTLTTNPLKLAKALRSTLTTSYSLRTIIPENMIVKNQGQTGTCYAFSSLAALESTLALKDYKNGMNPVVYDFSERHMEYATSQTFLNGEINENGHAREVGDGGVTGVPIAYLTNGTGAIAEEEMPFKNNENKIALSEIQNKTVITQVNDTIEFPAYSSTEDTTEIKKQMKEHIMNYGAIDAGIHGANLMNQDCYNNTTGAIYCSNSFLYPVDHAVIIVGWDDNYSKTNFNEGNQPTSNGAWIIRNSWGAGESYTLAEMKQFIYDNFPNEREECGWTSAESISDELAKTNFSNWGYTIDENNVATLKIGDNGFMYVSYEDVNIYTDLTGIIDAQSGVSYENIYQYDYYGSFLSLPFSGNKTYLATVFNKQTTGTEYLTQVAINASEEYTCKVYVNPNGTSKAKKDLQQVELKDGETETFDAGYHTIEFSNPIKINSNSFVVVLEVEGKRTNEISVMAEFNFGEFFTESEYNDAVLHCYDNVTVENGKCFMTTEAGMSTNQWEDTSKLYSLTSGNYPNFDTTIKAFTTSKVLESINITTPPTKTKYLEKENFDKTGMVVQAKYGNGKTEEITDYTITDGTNLSLGQTSVTISYKGKTTTQSIQVIKNSVESISIKNAPNKTQYWAGEDFDATGMVIEATYKDGTTKQITDYTITDGKNLKNAQTTVTISYEGKTVTQAITVQANPVVSIEIKNAPNKVKYVVGQDFDKTGMVVEATYKNGMVKQVEDYTIQDGEDLQQNQTFVTISYEGKSVTQAITVEVKTVTSISVKSEPTKTEYIQNKEELDLTGGIIEVSYNDNTKDDMIMISNKISVSGFDNKKLGTQTITLTYKGKTTQFSIEVKEEAKPENSNFDNMKGNVKRVRAYYFTDDNKKEYTLLNVELNNIIKATENDKIEYYYYLSPNQEEIDIKNWVKINNIQESENQLAFEINTSEISNYEEVSNSDVLYLYVKEVATRNDITKEVITSSVLLEVENVKIEEYLDGEKKAEVNPGVNTDSTPGDKNDSTVAPGIIPNAGKNILIIGIALVILVIGRLAYIRYKNIKIK